MYSMMSFIFQRKSWISSFLIATLILVSLGSGSALAEEKLPVLDRIVATVNRDAISESELNRQTQVLLLRLRQSDMELPSFETVRKQLLDKLILEKVQLQMAKEQGISVTDEELNAAIEDIAKRDKLSTDQMYDILKEQGMTEDQFKDNIKNEMIISRLQQREIGHQIIISNSDVEQFLNSPHGQDHTGVEYRLGHILISLPETPTTEQVTQAQKKAEDLVKQLKAGGDFAQIAMAKSSGPQALNGGDLGFRTRQELPTLFAKLIGNLNKGELMGPVRNDSGFHIIKLLDKRSGNQDENTTKDDLKAKATDAIFQRRFEEKLATWLRRVRDDAEVHIYLNEQT